jgi:hypothetical protein
LRAPPKRTDAANDEVPARQIFSRARFPKAEDIEDIEDIELKQLVECYGTKDWAMIVHIMITKRISRQCRDRWNFYLAPEIDHPPWIAVDRRG